MEQAQQKTLPAIEPLVQEPSSSAPGRGNKAKSPITTETMAALYIKQGYRDKALLVYEEIYQADPSRKDIAAKIIALRGEMGVSEDITPFEPAELKEHQPGESLLKKVLPDDYGADRLAPASAPDIARPSKALKEWWEGDQEAKPRRKWEQMTEEEKGAERLRSYLEIIRREEKK